MKSWHKSRTGKMYVLVFWKDHSTAALKKLKNILILSNIIQHQAHKL